MYDDIKSINNQIQNCQTLYGISSSAVYINNYDYTTAINNLNFNPSSWQFSYETIFNQTNGCKSNGTAWKCWAMS
jgi:hypothetical protein